jgi:hypothetical protein
MKKPEAKTGPKESVISYCLLGGIFLLGGVLFLKQNQFDINRYGLAENQLRTDQQKSSSHIDISEYLPENLTPISQASIYTENNLYEKINGKAPQYIESGFAELVNQLFADRQSQSDIIEVSLYDMQTARNSFSIFSSQRRVDSQAVTGIPFSYKTENAVYMVLGRYYAEIVSYTTSPQAKENLLSITNKLYELLGEQVRGKLAEIDILSTEELIEDSLTLSASNTFGFTELDHTFTGKYEINGITVTGFVKTCRDESQSAEKAQMYQQFLLDNEGVEIVYKGAIPNAFMVDLFGYIEFVFYFENYICGVHQADNKESAVALAGKIFDRLKTKYGE